MRRRPFLSRTKLVDVNQKNSRGRGGLLNFLKREEEEPPSSISFCADQLFSTFWGGNKVPTTISIASHIRTKYKRLFLLLLLALAWELKVPPPPVQLPRHALLLSSFNDLFSGKWK